MSLEQFNSSPTKEDSNLQSRSEYIPPSTELIQSMSLQELERAYERIEEERMRLINTPRSAINRFGEAKRLARIGVEMLTRLEILRKN